MSISLSSGVRSALSSLQNTTSLIDAQSVKLSTGYKVNSAIDNPSSFFTAASLNSRASDLNGLLDRVGQGVKTLEAADNGIKSLTKLVENAQGLARQARQSTDATARADLATQFGAIRTQIDQLVNDTGYNGVNLLKGDNLKVDFNENATSSLTLTGTTFDAAGLGIAAASNAFVANVDVDASISNLGDALKKLRSQAATFGANLSVVKTRQDFSKATINTLKTGADQLILADTNEEAAALVTLQTRQQLASQTLSFANQSDKNVLSLFR